MAETDITIRKIRNRNNLDNSVFLELYQRLMLGDTTLIFEEKFFLLKIAVYFLNSKENNVERLGYRIVLRYSNLFSDYIPLHEVALSRDYIPVAKFIENKYFVETDRVESFSNLFIEAYQEGFKIDGDKQHIYRSRGQINLSAFSGRELNIAVIAPTSYGKSEMIIKKIENSLGKKICVIVPSKALLAQTKKLLLNNQFIKEYYRKIITHPDMYKENDVNFLAVLTQERLLRLLQKYKFLALDLVLVDEAHNILEDNERAHLLAQVLLIIQNRNQNFAVNFFTPFLVDIESLKIRNHSIGLEGLPISEFMKVERFFAFDLETKSLSLYDQFLDRAFPISVDNEISSDIRFILAYKASKNIVYLNRPMAVEKFALDATFQRDDYMLTPEIEKIIKSIGDFIHPDYNLVRCIKNGILFHHGGIPDIVRLYVEEIYSKYPNFEFIITTSTLLEGVNIPAEKIFILNPYKGRGHLSAAQFKNLIGRVCRFKEVFNPENGSLNLLEPEIYLIKGENAPRAFSLMTFYNTKVNSSIIIEDEIKNPLLEGSEDSPKVIDILEYLENMETGASGLQDVHSPETEIGKLCFSNNILDFNILANELILTANFDSYIQFRLGKISSGESLISAIVIIFFEHVNLYPENENLIRLKDHNEARKFYSMFVNWRSQGAPYPLMIARFMKYWEKRISDGDAIIYIGSKWGEEVRGDSHKRLYVNMTLKSEVQMVNLAISKIKEEQEFVEFNILKYLEILTELGLVDEDFYDQVKYGTSNKEVICMLKNGFSMELAKLLTTSYRNSLELNLDQDTVSYSVELVIQMRQNEENEILIFEAESNL